MDRPVDMSGMFWYLKNNNNNNNGTRIKGTGNKWKYRKRHKFSDKIFAWGITTVDVLMVTSGPLARGWVRLSMLISSDIFSSAMYSCAMFIYIRML